MNDTTRRILVLSALGLATAGAALASGSGGLPSIHGMPRSPKEQAIEAYNDGTSYLEKITKLDQEAAAETDAAKRAKLEAKIHDKFDSAIDRFKEATNKNPELFQAWGSLGFAYRRTGNYDASLAAYGRALELKADYTPAIEYRAEAYLGLNRLDDVRAAYMVLFNLDRPRADELVVACDKWIQQRQADPAGIDAAAMTTFASWVSERKQIATQTVPTSAASRAW